LVTDRLNYYVNDLSGDEVVATETRRIDFSSHGLEQVPEYIFGLTDLEELDLSDNQLIGALSAEIRHLRKLHVLDISDNRMTGVSVEIG